MNEFRATVPLPEELRVRHEADIITLCDANTTIGYCRYSPDGEVEYLFVQSSRRRQGLALWLLEQVREAVDKPLRFREPLSPAGRALVEAYARGVARAVKAAESPAVVYPH